MQPALVTTDRLVLRPLTQADAVDFHALVTRPEVARMLFMFYPEWPLEAAKAFIDEWAWRGAALRFRLAITANNQWIGWIGVSDDPIPEIFYALTAEAAGKGYAAEAVAGFCAFLFDRFDMPALAAGVFADNPASARVLEKCGFALVSQEMHASRGREALSPSFTFHLQRPKADGVVPPLRSHLRTARLSLRPVAASDEAAIVGGINDLAISSWLSRVPYPYTPADFAEFHRDIAYPGETFIIEDAAGFAGVIGAGFELGYWLVPRAHGLGYATEAARAVLDMQFAHDESTVVAGYFEGNARSARVLAKLGFVETGRKLNHCRALGQDRPHVDLMLCREAYAAANPLEIQTEHLRLAPLDIERDWRDIARIGGDPRVARMTSSHRSPWSETDVRAFLADCQWQGKPGFRLGVWFQGQLIGAVGIWDNPAEIGYFLDPAFWGRGFATEAMAAFLPQMMARFGMSEVIADHCTDNPASGAVLRKLGFQQTGESIGDSLERGPLPITLYRLTAADINER